MSEFIAGMATTPERYDYVGRAARSIARQVDRLYLYVNDNAGGRPPVDFPDNVEVLLSWQQEGDLLDAGKFYGAQFHDDAFYFTCDDDLIYPDTYVDDLWSGITERYCEAACSYHGCLVPDRRIDSYYSNQQHKSHFRLEQDRDMRAHVLGTGVMGMYLPDVSVPMDAFGSKPHADLYAAWHFQQEATPCVVLPHPEGWIEKVDGVESAPEISESDKLDSIQARFISQRTWSLH